MKPSQYIEAFLSYKSVTEGSKLFYRKTLERFFLWIHSMHKDCNDLRPPDIINYFDYLNGQKLSNAYIRTIYSTLKSFFYWASLYCEPYRDQKPIMEFIKKPQYDPGFKRLPLSQYEVEKLLTSIDRNTQAGQRDYCLISLMLVTSLRRCEVVGINMSDFSIRNGKHMLWVKKKGRKQKDRFVMIPDHLREIINQYQENRICFDDEMPLYTAVGGCRRGKRLRMNSVTDILKERLKSIGLDSKFYTAHSLRHTAACLLLDATGDFHSVQLHLGHSSPRITQLYTRLLDEQKMIENKSGELLQNMIFKQNNSKQTE